MGVLLGVIVSCRLYSLNQGVIKVSVDLEIGTYILFE